jgi:hypothetical protein
VTVAPVKPVAAKPVVSASSSKKQKPDSAPKAAPATATAAPAKSATAKPAATVAPVLSAKEQKLQDLSARYKADKLTPQEYHDQRAAILAEP